MALAERYYHHYCNSIGEVCRVSILQEGFVGSATEVEGQEIPFRKVIENSSEFKFEPIRPSMANVSLVFGTGNGVDMEDLWTADEREFKVEHYIDSALDWVGWVIPNGFAYEFVGGLYYAELEAADGLSILEDIQFEYAPGELYGTQNLTYNDGPLFPFVLIATEILRKLGLDLNLWTCVDVYERSMTKTGDTRDADPLATSYAHVGTYIDDADKPDQPYWAFADNAMNCKEVLENLCYLFAAKVYQSEGVWRIKRINADITYGTGDNQRYWRKYNTLAVYLGREVINKEEIIPCSTIDKAMIGNDHIMRMDEVYGAFRVNYKFRILRVGDDPLNLINNGNFEGWSNTSRLSAPPGWFRWKDANNYHLGARPLDVSGESPGGITTAMELRQDPGQSDHNIDENTHPWNSIRHSEPIAVNKGDELILSFWEKNLPVPAGNHKKRMTMLFRVQLYTEKGELWFLRNNTSTEAGLSYLDWIKATDDKQWNIPNPITNSNVKVSDDIFVAFSAEYMQGAGILDLHTFKWRFYSSDIAKVPDTGILVFDVHGVAKPIGQSKSHRPPLKQYLWQSTKSFGQTTSISVGELKETNLYTPTEGEFISNGGDVAHPIITGLKLGRIPNPAELPEEDYYLYENDQNYSMEVDPIEILNGDTLDEQHISGIHVPTNVSGRKNFWDTIDNQFGISSLGLVQAKSIMQLYFRPFRILEGTIKAPGATMDTRFEFEALPGKKFMLLHATFNEKKNYIEDGVFFQISDEVLPPGGRESNNSLNPQWVNTGRFRCKKSIGVNTGWVEQQQYDANPNSPSAGDIRWVDSYQDIVECPIGDPSPYYWGTDDSTLDIDNLSYDNWTEEDDGISVSFTNPGGEYVYFVHLASLGLVEQISTDAQDAIISDFQYLSDITVDGYTYRVLRQNYVTTQFDDINVTFTFT